VGSYRSLPYLYSTDCWNSNWNNASVKAAFIPPKGMNYSTDLWAPELHNINKKWYVIFTADPHSDGPPPETDMFCEFSCPAVNHR